MDRNFLQLLIVKTNFPEEARQELLRCAGRLAECGQEEALDGAVEFFYEHDCSIKLTTPLMESIAEESGVHLYTVWLLFLIACAAPAQKAFAESGVDGQVFWDTFEDLKYKALECKNVHGVWGNFVSFWYPIFYTMDIFKLGRLEYENCVYDREEPYEKSGFVLKKGDPVKSIHIPSSGEPFDEAARLASYRAAYDFFREELHGGPLCCICDSWLLYPENRRILAPGSNIAGFMNDFDIVDSRDDKAFGDAWRVFGPDYRKPLAELPEATSMQRAFKKHLLSGGKTGEGFGILIFDGERIVNR